MKAWRLHSYGDFRFEDVALPEVKPGWALVKVKVVQPGVVDKGLVEGVPHLLQARIGKMLSESIPVQLGHEYCGEVVEVGPDVATLKVGDRVCSGGQVSCGTCRMCRAGKESQCLAAMGIGVEIPGAFAEYMAIPEWGLAKMPEGPTDNEVAALQPLGICVANVRTADIQMGDTVVVMGQGAAGLGVLQVAKLAGAGLLIGVDIRDEILELSRDFGANVVINSCETDPVKEVKRLTGDLGADVVFEAAGGRVEDGLAGFQTIQQALQMVRKGGKVVQVANLEGTLGLDTVFMRSRRIRYIFPDSGGTEAVAYAAFLVADKRITVGPQITHTVEGLEKLPEAMEITANKAKYHAANPAQVVLCR